MNEDRFREIVREELESLLLSEEFMKRFAHAFVHTELPSTIKAIHAFDPDLANEHKSLDGPLT